MAKLRTPLRWRNASVAGACAIVALLPFAQRGTTNGSDLNEKFATVLVDLLEAVPQEHGPALQERASQTRPLALEALPKSVRDAMQGRHLRINARNEVQVYVLVDEVNDDNLQQLKAVGVVVEITDPAHRRLQARIPVARLEAVADLPFVNFVRQPTYAVHHAGAATTEGDAILRASAARQQFGLSGTGVKVGVISDGLKGIFATGCTSCAGAAGGPIATGDLPNATGTRTLVSGQYVLTSSSGGIAGRSFSTPADLEGLQPGCAFRGAGAEGTALLEVVHDIAPGAQLSFANADTDLAFQQAVSFLASTNDVVVDDLGFYGEAYDGTSPVSSNTAAALNNAANRIRTYVTANGNAADEHYIGTYSDSGTDGTSIGITNSGHLHQFASSADTVDVLAAGPSPYNLIKLPAGGEVVIFLTWDDPWGASSNNYDLYLVRDSTKTVVGKPSVVKQNGSQDPLEWIDYVNTVTPAGAPPENFGIVIQNVNGAAQPKQLNLFSFQPECASGGPALLAPGRHERHSYNTATRSVAAQSDAGGSPVSVISAGAICSASSSAIAATRNTDESCNDPTNSTIEFFSSLGPTIDGRTKPDVSAIDGVSITGAGSFPSVPVTPFFGTSAAAPHVAGIAALLLEASPCLVSGATGAVDAVTARSALRNLIVGNADPLGDAPPNNVFGTGRVNAVSAVQKTLPVFSGPLALTVPGNTPGGATITAAQFGFTDPYQCAVTRVSATAGCTTSGANVTCPFGTTTTSVSASNNGVSYSPTTNVQVTVTSFSVGGSPSTGTLAAGQSAQYQVTVAPVGGAFASPVTLACDSLPSRASCSFTPAAVTPGTAPATSTVTISTTARAASRVALTAPASRTPPPHVPLVPIASVAVAVMVAFIPRRGAVRWWRRATLPLAALVLGLALGQLACGSSPAPQTPPPAGTPAGTYQVRVTGSSGTLVQSGTVTLVVQ